MQFDQIHIFALITLVFFFLVNLWFLFLHKKLKKLNSNLQGRLERKTHRLEEVNKTQVNTFIKFAHETKTPLTLINNYLKEYINQNGINKELKIIQDNLYQLTNFIKNFFVLEKLKRGVNAFDHEQSTNFSSILLDNVQIFEPLAEKYGLALINKIDENVIVKADPEAIQAVVKNLISNAIQYTKDGVIKVSLKLNMGLVKFLVSDTGVGIDNSELENILMPYYQIDSSPHSQGLGMGLALIKDIADQLQAILKIESDTSTGNRGTKVTFQMTAFEDQNVEFTDYEIDEGLKGSIKKTDYNTLLDYEGDPSRAGILIVEDNFSMTQFLFEKLKVRYNVFTATNGTVALQKLENNSNIDLIICDVMMGEMNGFELFSELMKKKKLIHIPVIFLTAKASGKMEGLDLGAIDYIQKPFEIEELLRKVDNILKIINNQRTLLIERTSDILLKEIKGSPSEKSKEDFFKLYNLTARETEIFHSLLDGMKYKQIADKHFISYKTVSKHVQNIYEKLQVSSRAELINLYNKFSD